QVVAALAHQCGQIAVQLRGYAVFVRDRRGVHPHQIRDAAARVEDGDGIVDELEGVPDPGADQYHVPGAGAAGGQGGEAVVGLEASVGEGDDAQGPQHLLDQRDLAAELLRGFVPRAFVVRVGLLAEGVAGDVEGHRHVGGFLVPEQVDQHRGEAVDGVGDLAGAGGEVLGGQGEEGPVGHRVAVDDQEQGSRV